MEINISGSLFKRSDRVKQLLKEEISAILSDRIKDPRIGMVTLTYVKMSDDLKNASIYFSVIGTAEQKNNSIEGINSARGFIQRELGQRLTLRYTPKISFYYDNSFDKADRISRLLKEIE